MKKALSYGYFPRDYEVPHKTLGKINGSDNDQFRWVSDRTLCLTVSADVILRQTPFTRKKQRRFQFFTIMFCP